VSDGSGRPRVLVAEDEEGTLALMAETLTAAGFEVVRSRDGLEALRRMREAPPDIALLDVMMPGLDGREVCSRMRVDPALSHVPIVMVTGADERHIDWGGCGADGFLAKPFRLARLPEIVRQYLATHAGRAPRARRLSDADVQALAEEIRRAVRAPRILDRREDVLAPGRELSAEDEARVEAALLALLQSSRAKKRGASGELERGGDEESETGERDDDAR
jgi:two-component system phosphate regulon response regulator PhoB